MEHDLPQKRVVTAEDLVRVCERVDSSEETTVQPTTTLKNEIGHFLGHISLASRALDILQHPCAVALGDEFKAEDPIFGKVHVGCEDASICTVHLLTRKVLLQRPVSGFVILQGNVAVRGKGAGQDGNEAESAL